MELRSRVEEDVPVGRRRLAFLSIGLDDVARFRTLGNTNTEIERFSEKQLLRFEVESERVPEEFAVTPVGHSEVGGFGIGLAADIALIIGAKEEAHGLADGEGGVGGDSDEDDADDEEEVTTAVGAASFGIDADVGVRSSIV